MSKSRERIKSLRRLSSFLFCEVRLKFLQTEHKVGCHKYIWRQISRLQDRWIARQPPKLSTLCLGCFHCLLALMRWGPNRRTTKRQALIWRKQLLVPDQLGVSSLLRSSPPMWALNQRCLQSLKAKRVIVNGAAGGSYVVSHLNATQRLNADCGFYYYLRGLILLRTFLVNPEYPHSCKGFAETLKRTQESQCCKCFAEILRITQESIPLLQRLCGN